MALNGCGQIELTRKWVWFYSHTTPTVSVQIFDSQWDLNACWVVSGASYALVDGWPARLIESECLNERLLKERTQIRTSVIYSLVRHKILILTVGHTQYTYPSGGCHKIIIYKFLFTAPPSQNWPIMNETWTGTSTSTTPTGQSRLSTLVLCTMYSEWCGPMVIRFFN